MTQQQFDTHWRRIKDKFPHHFKVEEHEDREYADWFDLIGKRYESDVFKRTLDFYFLKLSTGYFPDMRVIQSRCEQFKQPETYKLEVPNEKASIKPFYDAIQGVKERIKKREVPVGFTDNHFKGGVFTDYTKVKSMAEVIVEAFRYQYEAPALAEHRRSKLRMERVDLDQNMLVDGVVHAPDRQIKQKLCYYCEERVVKIKEVFTCNKCGVKYK